MNEKKLIRKQLIKNMFYTFIVFAVILICFDLIIYNRVSVSLFKSVDEEFTRTIQMYNDRGLNKNFEQDQIIPKEINEENERKPIDSQDKTMNLDRFIDFKINPRLISIIRNSNGEILNNDNIGRFDDYIDDITFNKDKIGEIYEIKVQNEYKYRGITIKTNNTENEEVYIQLLANVDGEVETINNLREILLIGNILILIVAIVSSYMLSKMTLKPIMESYRKQTEFVQNAAHELRTPLTIIQAKQELLLQEPNSKIIDKSEDINIILKETKRLTKLIKELMILATADSNKLKLEKEKTNIDSLIKEVIMPYKEYGEMQKKKIIMDLKYGKEINIDVNRISQLMIIVLDNSIKYTRENDKIKITTHQKDGKCLIEIEDTGIGICKEAAKHVFDRFYREDKARSREKGGTGLGLSIAHTIVKLHGGTIKIVPNEPKGTKVIIKI